MRTRARLFSFPSEVNQVTSKVLVMVDEGIMAK